MRKVNAAGRVGQDKQEQHIKPDGRAWDDVVKNLRKGGSA